MRLVEVKHSDGKLWSHYWSESEAAGAMCIDHRVVSVACHLHFYFRGRNLIGISDAAARMQFRSQTLTIGEFPNGYTLEVLELGLELTMQDNAVLIATAFDEPLKPSNETFQTDSDE